MSHVLDGDQWKHTPEPAPDAGVILRQRTRAEQQAWIDEAFAKKRVNLAQWRFQTDFLSRQDALGNPLPL